MKNVKSLLVNFINTFCNYCKMQLKTVRSTLLCRNPEGRYLSMCLGKSKMQTIKESGHIVGGRLKLGSPSKHERWCLTCVVVKVDSPSHGVNNRLWLLKDLLLHEGTVVACNGEIKGRCPALEKLSDKRSHLHKLGSNVALTIRFSRKLFQVYFIVLLTFRATKLNNPLI